MFLESATIGILTAVSTSGICKCELDVIPSPIGSGSPRTERLLSWKANNFGWAIATATAATEILMRYISKEGSLGREELNGYLSRSVLKRVVERRLFVCKMEFLSEFLGLSPSSAEEGGEVMGRNGPVSLSQDLLPGEES